MCINPEQGKLLDMLLALLMKERKLGQLNLLPMPLDLLVPYLIPLPLVLLLYIRLLLSFHLDMLLGQLWMDSPEGGSTGSARAAATGSTVYASRSRSGE